jgi:hypothetical protein
MQKRYGPKKVMAMFFWVLIIYNSRLRLTFFCVQKFALFKNYFVLCVYWQIYVTVIIFMHIVYYDGP